MDLKTLMKPAGSEPKSLRLSAKERVIVALDVDAGRARQIVLATKEFAGIFKVGPVLWLEWGKDCLAFFKDQNARLFLDFKFHDIPNTVGETIKTLIREDSSRATWGLTLHASGGYAMIKAAVSARDEAQSPIKIFGVTVLTSLREKDLYRVGINRSIEAQVKKLAVLAMDAGCDGVVSSAHEALAIRKACGRDCICVVPGIRLEANASNRWDQKRVATPVEALDLGADYLVVGRDIVSAPDPLERARALLGAVASWQNSKKGKGGVQWAS